MQFRIRSTRNDIGIVTQAHVYSTKIHYFTLLRSQENLLKT